MGIQKTDSKQTWESYLHVGIREMDPAETLGPCLHRKMDLAETLMPYQTLGFYKNFLKGPQILYRHQGSRTLSIRWALFTTKIEILVLVQLSPYLNFINKLHDEENIFVEQWNNSSDEPS